MAEENRTFIPTKSSLIHHAPMSSLALGEKPFIDAYEKLSPQEKLQRMDDLRDKYRSYESDVKHTRPRLKHPRDGGMNDAARVLNNYRRFLGLNYVRDSDLDYINLSPESWSALVKDEKVPTLNDDNLGGLYDAYSVDSFVKDDPLIPDYLYVSIVLHEAIHRHLENTVFAYYQEINKKENKDLELRFGARKRRSGLFVESFDRPPSNSEDVDERRWFGEILNEIPNLMIQREFIAKALEDELYQDEAQARSRLLQEQFGNASAVHIRFDELGPVRLDVDNIHFSKDSKPIIGTSELLTQLGTDLSRVCETEGEDDLWKLMLRAKLNPKLISRLRNRIDAAMGKGFYKKLRAVEDISSLDTVRLLHEVQERLYRTS